MDAMMIMLIVLLLAAAGFGVYWFMIREKEDEAVTPAVETYRNRPRALRAMRR